MKQIVTTDWLAEHLQDETIVIADARWVHMDSAAAYASYLQGHIPGAVFVDVDSVLSELGDYSKGRHPLPNPEDMVRKLASIGIGQGKFVVATEGDSFKVSARLWWLLRWIGVDDVAVLDGGFVKWQAEGREVETREHKRLPVSPYPVRLRSEMMSDAIEVERNLARGETVLDARAAERYRGEIEPLDKRAGHIEGARSIPLADLLTGDPPRLKSLEELRALFGEAGITDDESVTAYCGSGVTACQLLLALDQAGYGKLQLYPGSWSEWIELHPEAGVKLT